MKRIAFILGFALLLPYLALAQVSGVDVSVSIEQDQFLPDEDLVVTLRVVNRSGRALEFGATPDWVVFSVEGEGSLVVPKLSEMPVVEPFKLQSAQVATREFNLTPYFGFRRTGCYRVAATVKIPEWDAKVSSVPAVFTIMNGVTLPGVPDLQFGVPPSPGSSNSIPEVRRYVLQKGTGRNENQLYFRLTDATGAKTFKVFPLDRLVSFSRPETQIDGFSNLHLIYQYYAKSFRYCVISPEGKIIVRQTHDYTDTRPSLRTDSDGRIFVFGGVRKLNIADIPAIVPPTFPANTNAAPTP